MNLKTALGFGPGEIGHASGSLKRVSARAAVVMPRQQDSLPHPSTASAARILLLSQRIRHVVLASPRAPNPVPGVWR
ncbi:MAG TPA: hypothetical protein ENI37_07930 [Chloroflexi bacterium]|nr:hypothetical protein [Chloroflexota bacterium]